MKIKIFAMTHRKFTPPQDPMYIPLQVGRACHDSLGYQGDDNGDNISRLNPYYAELSGAYWVWKNVTDADYIGICHYRRYLLNEKEELFREQELLSLFRDYDILTSKRLTLNFSYAYGFEKNHTRADLDAARTAVKTLYPDFYPLFEQRLNENHTTFGNLMICSRELYCSYCAFLFPIFAFMHPLLDLDSYDDYHRRLYGFLSEFILMVWCEFRGLRVKECKVGLVGEKKETGDVIATLWKMLSTLGQTTDATKAREIIRTAKTYFLDIHEKRPDILMEASDIHGYLHLCLQALSIAEHELDSQERITFPLHRCGEDLMQYLQRLNQALLRTAGGCQTSEDAALLSDPALSREALTISLRLYCPDVSAESFLAQHLFS